MPLPRTNGIVPQAADTVRTESATPGDRLLTPQVPDHELIRCIGAGSYGEVWLARNIMGTYRAVKVVYRSTFDNDRPFEREFNGIQRFEPISRSHDGLVDILQVGRTDTSFYYVMELADDTVQGQRIDPNAYQPKTLRTAAAERGSLPVEECVELALALAGSLGHMHANGLIHRDIKPSNIIFVNGQPKLADIGLVAELGEARSFVGTEGFIPPEGPGTPQADIYSLGKVLYEICTGKDRLEFPVLPTRLGAGTEADDTLLELNAILNKACHTDRDRRYQSTTELRQELLILQSGRSVRKWRTIERRFEVLKKLSVLGSTLTLVIAVALFYAQRQARLQAELRRQAQLQLYAANMIVAEKALADGNVRRAQQILDEHQRFDGEDPRGFEYRYLRQLCAGDQAFALPKQDFALLAAAFSPDGTTLAIGGSYYRGYDYEGLATGQHLQRLGESVLGPQGPAGALKLFDSATWNVITNVSLPAIDSIRTLVFSSDGAMLAAGTESSAVRIWNTATYRTNSWFFAGGGRIKTTAFSADDRVLCALFLSDDDVRAFFAGKEFPAGIVFWDISTGQTTNLVTTGTGVNSFAFAPDRRMFAWTDVARNLHWWDLESGKPLGSVPIPSDGWVESMGFSPDSRTVALGMDNGITTLWHRAQPRRFTTIGYHQGAVLALAFSPRGDQLACGVADGTVRLWQLDSPTGSRLLRGHSQPVHAVAFSPHGDLLASASLDKTVRLWPTTEVETNLLRGHTDGIRAIDLSSDGSQVVTGGADRTVRIWELGSGAVTTLTGFTGEVRSVVLSPRGDTLVAAETGSLTVFRAPRWQIVTNLAQSTPKSTGTVTGMHGSGIFQLRFSNDGRFLFSSEWSTILVWDTVTWTQVTNLVCGISAISTACSQDGRLLAGAGGGGARVWEIGSWNLLDTHTTTEWTSALAFTPDARRMITGTASGAVRMFELRDPASSRSVQEHFGDINDLAVSVDGTLAVADASSTIKLWNLALGRPLLSLAGHSETVTCLDFSADANLLASGSMDGTVRLWRAARRTQSR